MLIDPLTFFWDFLKIDYFLVLHFTHFNCILPFHGKIGSYKKSGFDFLLYGSNKHSGPLSFSGTANNHTNQRNKPVIVFEKKREEIWT